MFDVVVCFYNEFALLPQVAHGLRANKDYISRVIISRDDEWHGEEEEAVRIVLGDFDLTFLGYPKDGCNTSKAINAGVRAATAEAIVQLDSDIILFPGALGILADEVEPTILRLGIAHDIERPPSLSTLQSGGIFPLRRDLREDKTLQHAKFPFKVRDLFLAYTRESYLKVGGHDETFQGYGFVDYKFGLDWAKAFGEESILDSAAQAYHMSGLKPGHDFTMESKAKFASSLRSHYAT